MKFLSILSLLLIGFSKPIYSQVPAVDSNSFYINKLDSKYGFREIKLGTPINQFSDLVLYDTTPDELITTYYRKNETFYLGSVYFKKILYKFYKGTLMSISVLVEDKSLDDFHDMIVKNYGEGHVTRSNNGIAGKEWIGNKMFISLTVDGECAFISIIIGKKMLEEIEAKKKSASDKL